MRDPSFYVNGLLDLHTLHSAEERRATWRQSMAALARAIGEGGPGPLETIHPQALALGVKAALASGLVEDLEWLAPPAAGAALYELASALPLGPEQREIGRRLMTRLLSANAEAFVAIATRMALGGPKALASPAIKARIALVTELPLSVGIDDGPLALALCSRRELAREWIVLHSTGPLPARRLAARLLERAAREAARRASQGDTHALRIFQVDVLGAAMNRLLSDRELLVWRHVAVARGLLGPWIPEIHEQIDASLAPTLSPTEWRRAATSIAASIAIDPVEGLKLAFANLSREWQGRDPGMAGAFVWGLARAAESEPDAAGQLLDKLIAEAGADIGEAIAEFAVEFGAAPLVERATDRVREAITASPRRFDGDDAAEALDRAIAQELKPKSASDAPTLRDKLTQGLLAFTTDGARSAYAIGLEALESVREIIYSLEAIGPEDDDAEGKVGAFARRASIVTLRDLDIGLLERSVLVNLLRLGSSGESARAQEEELDSLRDRLSDWLLTREGGSIGPADVTDDRTDRSRRSSMVFEPSHPTLRLRRLRTLLHLVDSDVGEYPEDGNAGPRVARLRQRWLRIANALMTRFERDPRSVLRRTATAALARALDALVRIGACDAIDVFLVIVRHIEDPVEAGILAEASMDPDLVNAFKRMAAFLRACVETQDASAQLKALDELARELTSESSSRTDAVRTVLVRLHSALQTIRAAPALRALSTTVGGDADIITALETSLGSMAQLTSGARARLSPEGTQAGGPSSQLVSRRFGVAVSRVLSGVEPRLSEHVVSACVDEMLAGVPRVIGRLASHIVWDLVDKPVDVPMSLEDPTKRAESVTGVKVSEQLPPWIPARRTLGGFYILRALGTGAAGSVFVASRVEERNGPDPERFALKVPDYSATAARSISEAQFLELFRSEASALMAIPPHANLARFVTFDAGARPKPILVMELIEGGNLEFVLASQALSIERVFRILDEVLAGLEAMHSVGVGHLDLKPSNVVLRKGEEAVLVDFGLSGRHVRPGCATGPYGSPEVWGALPPGEDASPLAADIYSFGCLAYEIVTGQTLFQADSEMVQIAMHVGHDGSPPLVKKLAQSPEFAPLAELLIASLRQNPRNRLTASQLRTGLKKLAPTLFHLKWPLAA